MNKLIYKEKIDNKRILHLLGLKISYTKKPKVIYVTQQAPTQQAGVIKSIIETCDYKSYLELGLYDGVNFNYVTQNIEFARGVDMEFIKNMPEGTFYQMTTDEFFEKNKYTFDAIFIDACHNYEQVKKDFENALKILNKNGVIFLHDTDPRDESWLPEYYCSDSYKMNDYIAAKEDLNFVTVPLEMAGLTIVKRKYDDRFRNFINT